MAKNLIEPYHNLYSMLEAGIPVVQSIKNVLPSLSGKLKHAFQSLADSVAKGNPFAEEMKKFPAVFKPFDILMIDAAERSGTLPEAFKALSQWHEMIHNTTRRMLSGFMMPILVLHIAAMIAPLPQFFLAQASFADCISQVFVVLLPVYMLAAAIYVAIRYVPPRGHIKRVFDRCVLRIPLLGTAIKCLSMAQFCRAFSLLCKAGVPADECAEKALLVTPNLIIADLFGGTTAAVRRGAPVSEGLSAKLPPEFLYSWQNGEESGSLDDVTNRLYKKYYEKGQFVLTEFAAWIPKIVYAAVSIFIVIKILQGAGGIMSNYSI